MDDLISRQMAIDAIWDGINMDIYTKEVKEILEELPSAEPEIIRCKDCKHRPYKSEDKQGFGIEFPDGICPCQCEDGWYNWRPDDDWFCAYGEAKDD